MRTRKIATFIMALSLAANAFAPFPAAMAEGEENLTTEAPVATAVAKVAAADENQGAAAFGTTADTAATTVAKATDTSSSTKAVTEAMTTPFTTVAYNPSYNPHDDIYKFRETDEKSNEVHIIDSAVLHVPYSYLLFPMSNVPQSTDGSTTTSATTSQTTTTESTSTSETTSASETQKPVETIPENLVIDGKGSEGNFTVDYYSDGSIVITGELDYAGPGVKIPSTVNGKRVRAICIGTESNAADYYGWNRVSTITVAAGVGLVVTNNKTSGFKSISYQEAAKMMEECGKTLVVEDATTAGLSISSESNVNANDGEWFYDEGGEATTTTAKLQDAVPTTSVTETTTSIQYRIPEGLTYYPESSELYGVPQETGTFIFSVTADARDADGAIAANKVTYTYELTIKENTNLNVYSASDYSYSILKPIGTDRGGYDYVLEAPVESVFRSEGEFGQFVALWLNGKRLEPGVDYEAESGSTVMTIYEQTLANPALTNQTGNNTIAAEFRITDTGRLNDANNTNPLRVTSQNFHFQNTTNTPTVTPYRPSGSVGELNPHVDPAPVNLVNVTPATSSGTTTTTVSSSDTGSSVVTGDNRPYWLYVSAALAGLLGIFTAFPRRKTKTGDEQ